MTLLIFCIIHLLTVRPLCIILFAHYFLLAAMTTFTDIPADIIHKILTLVPDKQTLLTAILTSTCFHVVYQQHPQTILRSICCDRLCFFQALRVAQNVLTPESQDPKTFEDQVELTMSVLSALERNTSILNDFEDVFSSW